MKQGYLIIKVHIVTFFFLFHNFTEWPKCFGSNSISKCYENILVHVFMFDFMFCVIWFLIFYQLYWKRLLIKLNRYNVHVYFVNVWTLDQKMALLIRYRAILFASAVNFGHLLHNKVVPPSWPNEKLFIWETVIK